MCSSFNKRVIILYCTLLSVFALLGVRLYKLSVSNESQSVLNGQYTRTIDAAQRQGLIYDRGMSLLSHKKDGFHVLVNPLQLDIPFSEAAFLLAEVCENISAEEFSERLKKNQVLNLVTKQNAEVSALQNKSGFYIFPKVQEKSPLCPHIIGYSNGDGAGVTGLKKQYEGVLQGLGGSVSVTYHANASWGIMPDSGFEIKDVGYSDFGGIVLTIDEKLQEFAESLEGQSIDRGAIVICDSSTGQLLCAASFPSYDTQKVESYLSSGHGELVNRITSGFTPGSVFKTVVAAAALEESSEYSDFIYECKGNIEVEGNIFKCHKTDGHGLQSLKAAYANSCNCYFIELGAKVGMQGILRTASSLGLGQDIYADFLHSRSSPLDGGLPYTSSLLSNISFGQGPLLFSPLDMANATNICVTGFKQNLRLVKGIYAQGIIKEPSLEEPQRVLKKDTVKALREMMVQCVTTGTGKAAKVQGIHSGGKTATAQTGQINQNGEEILHTWFCGFCPLKSGGEVTVTILCDGNGRALSTPAEIFGILSKYLYAEL